MSEAEPFDCDLLILGGSFLGIELVRRLRRSSRGRALQITLVDRQLRHPYIPLGHELLTGRIEQSVAAGTVLDSASYVSAAPKSRWVQGEVASLDPQTRCVTLADGRKLRARFVVIALGSELAPPPSLPGSSRMLAYKSSAQLEACEAALERTLGSAGTEHPSLVVVGGGITGVELCGDLAHLAQRRPAGWRAPKLTLVHGGERLLPGLHPRAGRAAARALRAQGVELRLQTRLERVQEHSLTLRGPEGLSELPCALPFWAGGLRPPAALATLGLPTTKEGWLKVGPTLQCTPASLEHPWVFAAGDAARIHGGEGRWPTMQRAIEAIVAARTCAHNILTLAHHRPSEHDLLPPLRPHRLLRDFPHGVSLGARSLLVFGPLVLPLAQVNIWFRRFLMRRYMARYGA